MAKDDVEPKSAKSKAFGVGVGSSVASDDVKPTKDVKFKVKIPFQAHICHNQVKPKPVPTGNFEEKPKPVPTGVRVIEVNTESFFTTIERWIFLLFHRSKLGKFTHIFGIVLFTLKVRKTQEGGVELCFLFLQFSY